MPVQIPDDSDFSSFKDQVLSEDGWKSRYNKGGVTVWCREEESSAVQKLKVRPRARAHSSAARADNSSRKADSGDSHVRSKALPTLCRIQKHLIRK